MFASKKKRENVFAYIKREFYFPKRGDVMALHMYLTLTLDLDMKCTLLWQGMHASCSTVQQSVKQRSLFHVYFASTSCLFLTCTHHNITDPSDKRAAKSTEKEAQHTTILRKWRVYCSKQSAASTPRQKTTNKMPSLRMFSHNILHEKAYRGRSCTGYI